MTGQLSESDAFIIRAQLPVKIKCVIRSQPFVYKVHQQGILEYAATESDLSRTCFHCDLSDQPRQGVEYFSGDGRNRSSCIPFLQ